MKQFKRNKGITLIALIVTIIVLIILAGVSINMLVGENGIINMAQRAKNETEQAAKDEQQALASAFERNYVTYNGQLHVEGTKLMNEHNEEIRLSGINVSIDTNGTRILDKNKLDTLKSWGVNMIRIGLGRYNNSTIAYNDASNLNQLYEIIDIATELDLYVDVVFWSGNNLDEDILAQANDYFTQIVTRYEKNTNIIYEIANEPANEWSEIKEYAQSVISTIRQKNNALILCPAGGSLGYFSEIIDSPLEIDNIMYASHIYGSMSYKTLTEAIINNVPVFVSEWQNGDADGTSATESQIDKTNMFILQMERYNISSAFFNLSLSRYNSIGFIKENCWNTDWNIDTNLDEFGLYFKNFVTGNYTQYQYSVEDYTLAKDSGLDYYQYFWNDNYRNRISKIVTTDNFSIPENTIRAWDISTGSGNIIAYIVQDENNIENYILYIATSGKYIYAKNGWRLFSHFENVEYMDLSYFNIDNVTTLQQWFNSCYKLKKIDGMENWNGDNITNMDATFAYAYSLEEVDLSNINVENATRVDMFFDTNENIKVYLKNITTAKIVYDIFKMYRVDNNIYYYDNENLINYVEN